MDDKLKVTFGAASSDFLNNIHWTDQNITGALQLNDGEIVPVPEPINVALGIFGVVFAGVAGFRRLRNRCGIRVSKKCDRETVANT